jgi:hypothetical protein
VANALAECGVWLTPAAQVGPSAMVCCDLPSTTPYYGELLHADVLVLINTRKIASSQFGLVQRGGGARHHLNSVRELSDQTSCSPNYKVAYSLSVGATHYHKLKETGYLRSCCSERPDHAGY